MRVIVFFDLPVETAAQRKEYSKFRRHLIKSGFMMMQESVYSKLALNGTSVNTITEDLRRNRPENGLIQILIVTENQYSKIETITGEFKSNLLDTDERLVIL